MITPDQIRAARGLLHISAAKLARQAGVHITTVQRIERCNSEIHANTDTVRKIQDTLEAAGIEFIEGERGYGVRLNLAKVPAE